MPPYIEIEIEIEMNRYFCRAVTAKSTRPDPRQPVAINAMPGVLGLMTIEDNKVVGLKVEPESVVGW